MFDLGWQELLIIAIVTLIVVGPKDLPKLFNRAGKLVGNIKEIKCMLNLLSAANQ